MGGSEVFARAVALVGDAAVWWRRPAQEPTPAMGSAPTIPAGKPQGLISTLKILSASFEKNLVVATTSARRSLQKATSLMNSYNSFVPLTIPESLSPLI